MAVARSQRTPLRSPLQVGVGLLVLVVVACHQSPASTTEVRSLPWETQRRFVMLGRVVRSLACLQDYDWKFPDEKCRQAVVGGSARLASIPTPLMKSLPPGSYPKLTRFLEQTRELHELVDEVKDEVALDEHEPDRLRIAGRSAQEAGELATNLSERMEVALSLNAPGWGSFEDLSEPVVGAKRPREATLSPSPTTTPVTTAAFAKTNEDGTVLATDAPRTTGRIVSASALVAPLIASTRLFDEARHDPGRLMEAAVRSRLKMEKLAEDINAWRRMSHAENLRAEATRYADQIDRLRGRLLRVSTIYAGAARRVIATTADELVYNEPDALFEKLKDEVRLAELYKPADP